MRVLVTGGAGFIGSHLVESLKTRGTEVAVLDNLATGKRQNVPDSVSLFRVDVCDREAVFRVFEQFRPTHVSHQAAQASVKLSVENPAKDAHVNILGGLNILDASRAHGVAHVVFASTGGAIYGEVPAPTRAAETWPSHPKSPYAASKAAFETYLHIYGQNFGLSSTVLRYANVYGPRQDPHGEAGVVAIFTGRLLGGLPIALYGKKVAGDRGCVRDYVFVQNVVEANLLALDSSLQGTYNVCTGHPTDTLTVAEAIGKALGCTPEIRPAPPRPGDLEESVLDPSKLAAVLPSAPWSFERGIQETVAYFRVASQGQG